MDPLSIVLTDTSEYEPGVDEYGMPVYWSKITEEHSTAPILDTGTFNYHEMMMHDDSNISSTKKLCRGNNATCMDPAINKEIGNFIDNTCFQWIKDVGQRRMMMIWLFSDRKSVV